MQSQINQVTATAICAPISSTEISDIVYWGSVLVGMIFIFGISHIVLRIYNDWRTSGKGLTNLIKVVRAESIWLIISMIGLVIAGYAIRLWL
ncbi:hypothetical protein [Cysteiniphilum litorale]|uniref:hypothetical protein n=1 Tax=Cysteiniphilum litorale TaxID=2056700 RepID=UPI003F8809DC